MTQVQTRLCHVFDRCYPVFVAIVDKLVVHYPWGCHQAWRYHVNTNTLVVDFLGKARGKPFKCGLTHPVNGTAASERGFFRMQGCM